MYGIPYIESFSVRSTPYHTGIAAHGDEHKKIKK